MRSSLRLFGLVLGCVSALGVAAGCATGVARFRLPDGSYEVKCEGPLSRCLIQMEQTCKDNGYDVLRATEKRERNGPNDLQTEIVRSEGIVRCRPTDALFSFPPAASAPVPVATEAPPLLPEHAPLPPLSASPPSPAAPVPGTPSAAPAPSSAPPPVP